MLRTIYRSIWTHIVIPDRSYLRICGPDSNKFLQGICTADTTLLQNKGDCFATTFLNPKGRVIADGILYRISQSGEEPTIMIETPKHCGPNLERFLSIYRLRSQVKISMDKNIETMLYPDNLTDPDAQLESRHQNLSQLTYVVVKDPRNEKFGVRELRKKHIETAETEQALQSHTPHPSASSTTAIPSSRIFFERYRFLHGVGEGSEVEGRIPLECNFDLLRAISFSKGCYTGQELVARTKFKGLIRKRVVPFLLSPSPPSFFPFLPLPPQLSQKIQVSSSLPPPSPSRIKVGDPVYYQSHSSSSSSSSSFITSPSPLSEHQGKRADGGEGVRGLEAGQVIAVSSGGEMGLALVRLEYLLPPSASSPPDSSSETSSSPPPPSPSPSPSPSPTRGRFIVVPETKEGGEVSQSDGIGGEGVGVTIFRPHWWPDIDPHTGKKIESSASE